MKNTTRRTASIMKKLFKKLSLFLVFTLVVSLTESDNVLAAPNGYVKALSISQKTVMIRVGENKTIPYKVKAKGKMSKKISVSVSNTKAKAAVKKGKIKISAKKTGMCKLTILTKGKDKKGKRIKKIVKIKVVKNTESTKAPLVTSMPRTYSPMPISVFATPVPGFKATSVPDPVATSAPAIKTTTAPDPVATSAPVIKTTTAPDPATTSACVIEPTPVVPPATTSMPAPSSDPVEVTRAEWISKVMEITEHNVQEELFDHDKNGNITYSFTDISEHKNADIIETAARYGIIPESVGEFRPDDAADREFFAVTSVRSIGLATNDLQSDFSDQAELAYEMEDEVAIQLELLELVNNEFLPAQVVTDAESKKAETILTDIMEGREIDEEHKDTIEYNEDVKLEEVKDYTVSEEEGTYTVKIPEEALLDDITQGDKLVLPSTDRYPEGIALDVESAALSSDEECWMIEGTAPEQMMDFMDAVDIEGKVEADLENITAVDGVATVEVTKSGEKGNTGYTTNKRQGRAGIEGAVDVKDKAKISYTIQEIETTASFYLSELKYSLDFDKKGVNKIYIGLPNVLSMKTDYKASKNFSKKIGEIPIKLGAGFSADIEVFLEAGISGEITMNLKLSNNIGMQYYNGCFYLEKSCQPSFDMAVDADLDAGARLQLGLYWMKGIKEIFGKDDPKPVYNVSTKWGMHGDATLHIRNDQYTSYQNLMCVDLGYYLYGNVNIGENSFLGDKFDLKKTWVLFDEKNSPLKGAWHLENRHKVDTCTYKGTTEDEEIPGGDLLLFGNAENLKNGDILLTDLYTWKSGSAWYQEPIATENGFVSKFSFWAGGGRDNYFGGADGMALIFSGKTGLGAAGEGLGFIGDGSYGVELDSYPRNSGDPIEKHIGIIKDRVSNHLAYKLDGRVDDSQWHRLEVKYRDHVLEVYLDSEFVLSIEDVILPEKVYVGISAATGDGYNKHMIRNFSVQE